MLVASSKAIPIITLGSTGNYNLLNGGSSVSYSVANAGANSTASSIHYGLTSSYGSVINNTNFNGPGSVVFTNELVGLTLNTVYHYSIFSSDISGSTNSPDAMFTNNAIGVVSYLALINYVRTAIGTNFNTNAFPYSISNLNSFSATNWTLVNANITGGAFTNPAILNGDSLVGNSFNSVVAVYNNVGYAPASSTGVTNSFYNIPLANTIGLFKFNLYEITTVTGTGNITNLLVWSDENGKHTNILSTNNVATLTSSNQSVGIFLHATTNISLILSPSSISGSPTVNVFGSVERLQ